MMVVHVEPGTGQTLVVSFPRDLWVTIPGIGKPKINAAFNADLGGGPNSVIAALQENFQIDVNHYVEVDFKTFESMVDAVGSVPVYVDRPVVDDFTGFMAVESGCIQLNGAEALACVRSRHPRYLNPTTGRLEEDTRADIGRIERQQDFIRRLAGIVVEQSMSDPFKGRDIAHDVVDDLRVDRGFDKRAAFDLVRRVPQRELRRHQRARVRHLPVHRGQRRGSAGALPRRHQRRAAARAPPHLRRRARHRGGAPADVRVKVLNGSGRAGLADETMAGLVAAGFVKGGTGNDLRGRVAVTEVRYANGADAKAQLVLQYVGQGAKLVRRPDPEGRRRGGGPRRRLRGAERVAVVRPPGGATDDAVGHHRRRPGRRVQLATGSVQRGRRSTGRVVGRLLALAGVAVDAGPLHRARRPVP